MLIRALPAIREQVPRCRPARRRGRSVRLYAAELAAAIGDGENIVFTGSVPSEELAKYHSAADVFRDAVAHPRGGLDVEGLGIVYLEASACGVPVVAGDSGGARRR